MFFLQLNVWEDVLFVGLKRPVRRSCPMARFPAGSLRRVLVGGGARAPGDPTRARLARPQVPNARRARVLRPLGAAAEEDAGVRPHDVPGD